jgi:hypothetical protein
MTIANGYSRYLFSIDGIVVTLAKASKNSV